MIRGQFVVHRLWKRWMFFFLCICTTKYGIIRKFWFLCFPGWHLPEITLFLSKEKFLYCEHVSYLSPANLSHVLMLQGKKSNQTLLLNSSFVMISLPPKTSSHQSSLVFLNHKGCSKSVFEGFCLLQIFCRVCKSVFIKPAGFRAQHACIHSFCHFLAFFSASLESSGSSGHYDLYHRFALHIGTV